MKTLVFDLETIPDERLIPNAESLRDTLQAPKNYKNPDVIDAWKDQQMQELVSKMGLHPLTGRVCAAGYAIVEDSQVVEKECFTLSNAEDAVLQSLTEKIDECGQYITFNGKKFDVPFYEVRSRICRVAPSYIATNPYDFTSHVDLLHAIGQPMRLDEIRKWYGIGSRTSSLGSEVWSLWQQGKIDEIRDHCLDDIDATVRLADILNYLEGPKSQRMVL